MNEKRRLTWIAYWSCAALVMVSVSWLGWRLLSLENAERESQLEAQRQATTRLALWRMDAEVSALLAQESSRPYFHYRAFYPQGRVYTNMLQPIASGDLLIPSPLLALPDPPILLHYEQSTGELTSPQAPTGSMQDVAESSLIDAASIDIAQQRLVRLRAVFMSSGQPVATLRDRFAERSERSRSSITRDRQLAEQGVPAPVLQERSAPGSYEKEQLDFSSREGLLNRAQQSSAARSYDPRARDEFEDADLRGMESITMDADETAAFKREMTGVNVKSLSAAALVTVGPFSGRWLDGVDLVFERTVRIGETSLTQGFWLDWEQLRPRLVLAVGNISSGFTIDPIFTSDIATETQGRLASLPARIRIELSAAPQFSALTPTRATASALMVGAIAAVGAVGLILRASVRLSERRGRFVSAVSHELRTPMTTFCLYAQMLADDMVKDEDKRRTYLATLKDESMRLSRIVENVLAYARLNRPVPATKLSRSAAGELIDAALPSLQHIAAESGITLEVNIPDDVRQAVLPVGADALDRILGNLVENACRYAKEAADRRVIITGSLGSRRVVIQVRDFGIGVPKGEERRIFGEFQRGRHGDQSRGLGIGLPLARELASRCGGELTHIRPDGEGAMFELSLPYDASGCG